LENMHDQRLEPSLASLKRSEQPISDSEAQAATEFLLEVATETTTRSLLISEAINALTTRILEDSAFPRLNSPYPDLYESLYVITRAGKQNSTIFATLLRLAQARLEHAPALVSELADDFQDWIAQPPPVLAPFVLEAFDLFAEYGLEGWHLERWSRACLENLLMQPRPNLLLLEVWDTYLEWTHTQDLRPQIAAHLADHEEESDPIADLPDKTMIAIFTRNASPARKAQQLLLSRNAKLDIRLCHEQDMNDQAESFARHADYVVLVTGNISHAISKGVISLIKDGELVYCHPTGAHMIVSALQQAVTKTRLPIEA